MPSYELFIIQTGQPGGRLIGDFPDDFTALERARALSGDHLVEVFEGIRFVARVNTSGIKTATSIIAAKATG